MTLFSLMECGELLAVDPKTLRHWLTQARMSLQLHPTDGRQKCLTHEQIQQLAALHGRTLKAHEACPPPSPVEMSPLEALEEPPQRQTIMHASPMNDASSILLEEDHLRQKLSQLEAQVVAQQQQLILLTRELLRERATRTERSISLFDAPAQPMGAPTLLGLSGENVTTSGAQRPLHPAEQRARFQVLPPLIEYSATGSYVVISAQEGEIPLIPDTLQWFEWFRTLSSFRFVGKSGHFGACRGYHHRPKRTWYAHRTIHQHEYKHYLGVSEHLTIAHLEQMAAKFQSYV